MAVQKAGKKEKETQLEEILDFCVGLGQEMIASGANLERVSLAVEQICHTYGLTELSLDLLSTHISLAIRDAYGQYAARQASIPPSTIHLARLKKLNRASYKVATERPSPVNLKSILIEASTVRETPDWIILIAQMCAMACLCLIFGGGWREVLPGIPLVNAARNLLCGNEMNGILQMFKATIETAALAMGIYLAIRLFNPNFPTGGEITAALFDPMLLVLILFCASVSFGANFRIEAKDLWLAGLGGALSRAALLVLTPVLPVPPRFDLHLYAYHICRRTYWYYGNHPHLYANPALGQEGVYHFPDLHDTLQSGLLNCR